MILSHHGQLEFGSPKLPQFPEALLLHYLDDMDSKMECMRSLIEKDRQVEGCFTTYNSALERVALKKERFLNGSGEAPHARDAASREAAAEAAGSAPSAPEPPAPAAADPALAAHPLFAASPDGDFADKLEQAGLAAAQPAAPKQES